MIIQPLNGFWLGTPSKINTGNQKNDQIEKGIIFQINNFQVPR